MKALFLPYQSSLSPPRAFLSSTLWVVGFILRLQAKYNITESVIARFVLFLSSLFSVLGRFSGFIAGLAHQFPRSLYCLRKMVKSNFQFTKYVVCPKCEQIYHRRSCTRRTASKDESMVCTYSEFLNKKSRSRTQCGQQLLKTVHLSSGKSILYPFKIYCYCSIQSYLKHYLLQPGFIENCNHWKKNPPNPDDLLVRDI